MEGFDTRLQLQALRAGDRSLLISANPQNVSPVIPVINEQQYAPEGASLIYENPQQFVQQEFLGNNVRYVQAAPVKSVVPSVVPQAQSVVPAVVQPAQLFLKPVTYTTNYSQPPVEQYMQTVNASQMQQNVPVAIQQPIVVQQPQLLPAPGTINGTVPINNGACSMLNDAKITALISDARKDVNKVTTPADPNQPAYSGFIKWITVDGNGTPSDVCVQTENVIYRYKSVISQVYNNYIKDNPNKGVLNENFQNFSNELIGKIFDVITKYNKLHSFVTLCKKGMLTTPEEINKYNEFLNENGNNALTAENKLCKEVYEAITEANGLLKFKLHEFNSSLKASKQQRANELFFPNSSNSEEQSVDDMAIDDCVFSKLNIDKLFPNANNMDSMDYDAREGFLKKLGIGEDDLSNAQFVCNINTFTDALLEAAQSAINNEYNEPSQGQYGCIRNCIKNAFDAAKGGWNRVNKVLKQLNNSIDGRVKGIVKERYQAIFKNIKQFIFSYDNYLNNKLKKAENDKEGSKISTLIKKNREMLKELKVPTGIDNSVGINNNVSQIGLNYRKFQGNSLDDLFN